ncbi:MAG: hypothetical protein E7298_03045 [Lachnospiraceae bacterium]|nr:hypothetical protein [Lachnospiraceae bacterium]
MIRKNYETMSAKEAVKKAVDERIDQGILRDFLLIHKAQVIKMSIYEYDEKKQRKLDREEGREEGLLEGQHTKVIVLIQKKVLKGKTLDIIADELESTIEEIRPFYDAVIKYPQDMKPEDILARVDL